MAAIWSADAPVTVILDALFRLDGKTALVVGAGGGVGEAAAALIGQVGARLITADAPAAPRRASTAAAASLAVDVCDEASVTGLLADIAARFGDIDILVYAATLPAGFAFETMSLADWRKVQEVNLQGAFLCLREA
ncbi:MAG: SDR family NAD(P)-dependent oxidoreductase, partial [Caulobacteraceae bacterium]|nr:SDR family NAD(P)-dependent oxidoreductase [Caulobacteraceae bacterium]